MEDVKLARYLSGEMTKEEIIHFEEEIETSNKEALLQKHKDQWNSVKQYPFVSSGKSDWADLEQRISVTEKNSSLPWILRIAAVLILATTGWFYMNTAPEMLFAETDSGEMKTIALADGSIIKLNYQSKLSYPESFSGDIRNVTLFEGEAFFKVARDETKPFRVLHGNNSVEVLGTEFNIHFRKNRSKVSVSEGKVRVKSNKFESSVILTKGFSSIILPNNAPSLASENNFSGNPSWLSERFVFKDVLLEDILSEIGFAYGFSIKLGKNVKNERITFIAKRTTTIKPILRKLLNPLSLKFSIESSKVTITKMD